MLRAAGDNHGLNLWIVGGATNRREQLFQQGDVQCIDRRRSETQDRQPVRRRVFNHPAACFPSPAPGFRLQHQRQLQRILGLFRLGIHLERLGGPLPGHAAA